jgi:hypothetical protein
MWKTLRVFHIPPPPTTTTDKYPTRRYTNIPLGTKNRSGHDYIRNLREETIKGFYGRLKQGFLPMPAPIGYLDCGAGKPKEIDPVRGPLVKQAFTLYTTCRFSHETLADKMFQLGLRTKSGKRLTATRWSAILNNPFLLRVNSYQENWDAIPRCAQTARVSGNTSPSEGHHVRQIPLRSTEARISIPLTL